MFSGYIDCKGDFYELSLSTSIEGFRLRARLDNKSWANTFTPLYISELTRKSGNHKDFDSFVTLLRDGITGSDNVDCKLQLLTPSDLISLRGQNTPRTSRPPSDRRYLLLTSQSSYEKTHFPLSLIPEAPTVLLRPDFAEVPLHSKNTFKDEKEEGLDLRTIISQLQAEIQRLKAPDTMNDQRSKFENLVYENLLLKKKLEEATTEIQNSKSSKNQRTIRKLVENMETGLAAEKARNKKIIAQKNTRIKNLEADLSECQSENRKLEIRTSKLKSELEPYKRGRNPLRRSNPIPLSTRERSINDRNRRTNSNDSRGKRQSYRSLHDGTQSSMAKRSRDVSPACSVSSRRSTSSVGSAKSIGSTGSRSSYKRFDPTAYIKAKQTRESDIKRRLVRNRKPPKEKTRSRGSSVDSTHSRTSRFTRKSTLTRCSTPDLSSDKDSLRSFPSGYEDSLIKDGSFNIVEIDARLQALQLYINEALT